MCRYRNGPTCSQSTAKLIISDLSAFKYRLYIPAWITLLSTSAAPFCSDTFFFFFFSYLFFFLTDFFFSLSSSYSIQLSSF